MNKHVQIEIDGRKYSSVEEMPPEDRAIYEAVQGVTGSDADNLLKAMHGDEEEAKALLARLRDAKGGAISVSTITKSWGRVQPEQHDDTEQAQPSANPRTAPSSVVIAPEHFPGSHWRSLLWCWPFGGFPAEAVTLHGNDAWPSTGEEAGWRTESAL